MPSYDSWESYFYPETYDPATGSGTLRNRFGERDPEVLNAKEYSRASLRETELRTDVASVPRSYDAEHVRGIHRHLFQDVYDWAGEYRTVNMVKPGAFRSFADVPTGEIDRYLGDAGRIVRATDWADLDRNDFGDAIADVYAHVNQAHPFREGNGRTTKLFLEHVAEQSRFTLAYNRIGKDDWNRAAEFSRPDIGAYKVMPESVIPLFRQIAVERPAKTASTRPERPDPGVRRELRGGDRYRGSRDPGRPSAGPRGLER
ncbi:MULTISPECIES: Fic/DOC family protein [Bacteria]|uniref:Fic/DOC family protein n=1 Tax=Bacteria TaxID=2 RepID=UPI003C7C2017